MQAESKGPHSGSQSLYSLPENKLWFENKTHPPTTNQGWLPGPRRTGCFSSIPFSLNSQVVNKANSPHPHPLLPTTGAWNEVETSRRSYLLLSLSLSPSHSFTSTSVFLWGTLPQSSVHAVGYLTPHAVQTVHVACQQPEYCSLPVMVQ